jgi:murein DD-endopeptidase MepM/ murein hydrolase activator NlpD
METDKIAIKGQFVNPVEPKQRDRNLKKACREFESVFMHQLLKTMRRTVEKCDLFHGGQGEEIYESLLDMELSKSMSGLGPNSIANMLYEQFTKPSGEAVAPAVQPTAGEVPQKTGHRPPRWPIVASVSSAFGWRKDPIDGTRRFHNGADFAATAGSPIRSVLAGRVVFSGQQRGYGNVVVVDHGGDLEALYAHNARNLVRKGDRVAGGTIIAEVGASGRSTGPHLHFEVRQGRTPVDPFNLLSALPSALAGA